MTRPAACRSDSAAAGKSAPSTCARRPDSALAPEAEGADRRQIIEARNLAGRVPRECERQVALPDAAAVITHAYQADAAALHVDLDARRTRIEGILGELLDHRGRALDHLAGGNSIDELAGKYPDRHAQRRVPPDAQAGR